MKSTLFKLSLGITVLCGCDDKKDVAPTVNTRTADSSTNRPNPATTRPDNTGINTRDRAPDAPTAGTQGQSKPEVEVTADIRRRIMDGNLSMNAQNSKVIYDKDKGKVTLRGPVKNQGEKDAIGRMAAEVVGAANVDNQLEVTPN